MKNRIIAVGLCLLLFASFAPAQQQHGTVITIKGSETPERIPDDVAYYQVLLALAPAPGDTDLALRHKAGLLAQIGLEPTVDTAEFKTALSAFRAQFDQIVNDKTNAVLAMKRINALVDATRQSLHKTMSLDANLKLDKFVQAKKHYITVTKGADQ